MVTRVDYLYKVRRQHKHNASYIRDRISPRSASLHQLPVKENSFKFPLLTYKARNGQVLLCLTELDLSHAHDAGLVVPTGYKLEWNCQVPMEPHLPHVRVDLKLSVTAQIEHCTQKQGSVALWVTTPCYQTLAMTFFGLLEVKRRICFRPIVPCIVPL